jgi:hypothetical protein
MAARRGVVAAERTRRRSGAAMVGGSGGRKAYSVLAMCYCTARPM